MKMGSVLKCMVFLLIIAIDIVIGCEQKPFYEEAAPTVATQYGSIKGKYIQVFDKKVAAFLGIPYGKPPVGEKRFLKSEPVDPWIGIKLAQKKPTPCMQHVTRDFNFLPKTTPSEDCLYLNIWTPANLCCGDTKKLPVLFWIFAGGFAFGSSDVEIYAGQNLASYGEVVVVTFNYRVGIFGFLNVGTLDAPGNAGMFDQVLALKWVHENIQYFGGDPKSVTIFGESAGSISTSLHLVSPLSRGLFHRVIQQSGTAYHKYLIESVDKAKIKASAISKAVGCSKRDSDLTLDTLGVLECLKRADAMELSKAESVTTSHTMVMFLPTPGNEFLPISSVELFDAHDIAPVDIMVGNVKNEGTIFLNFLMPELFPRDNTPKISSLGTRNAIKTLFYMVPESTAELIHDEYFKNASSNNKFVLTEKLSNSIGDFFFNCPILLLAEKVQNVYLYWMTHRSLRSPLADWTGVEHVSDIIYVFGLPLNDSEHYTPEDKKFSEDIINKWVTFARTGHPLPAGSKQIWKTFTTENPTALELNPRNYKNIRFPRKDDCDFWRPFFSSR